MNENLNSEESKKDSKKKGNGKAASKAKNQESKDVKTESKKEVLLNEAVPIFFNIGEDGALSVKPSTELLVSFSQIPVDKRYELLSAALSDERACAVLLDSVSLLDSDRESAARDEPNKASSKTVNGPSKENKTSPEQIGMDCIGCGSGFEEVLKEDPEYKKRIEAALAPIRQFPFPIRQDFYTPREMGEQLQPVKIDECELEPVDLSHLFTPIDLPQSSEDGGLLCFRNAEHISKFGLKIYKTTKNWKYIKNHKVPYICLIIAVSINAKALKYIKKKDITPELCMLAALNSAKIAKKYAPKQYKHLIVK